MTTEQTTSAAEPETQPGIIETVRQVIADELGRLFDRGKADVAEGGKPGGDPAPGRDRPDVSAEVRREVAKLKEDEQRQAEQKSLAERVHELEQKLAKAAENPPEEFRRVTEWMWR